MNMSESSFIPKTWRAFGILLFQRIVKRWTNRVRVQMRSRVQTTCAPLERNLRCCTKRNTRQRNLEDPSRKSSRQQDPKPEDLKRYIYKLKQNIVHTWLLCWDCFSLLVVLCYNFVFVLLQLDIVLVLM